MAAPVELDARGFTRCSRCGVRFKVNHSCHAGRGELVPRPDDFDALVAEARAEARADQVVQLALDELPVPCRSCGAEDVTLDPETGDCIPCIARAAIALAAAEEGLS